MFLLFCLHDSVYYPSVELASCGEEAVVVCEGVNAGNVNVFWFDVFAQELSAIAFPEVNVPFLCFWIARVGIALGKDVHWESVLGKEIVNFVAYLKAFRTNAWTYDGVKVGGIDAVGRDENIDVCLDNALESAFPSGMNGRYDVRCLVP